ncbi:MAG: TIGR03936 family radical SAM-associated protein [Pseudomonadota bacterium]
MKYRIKFSKKGEAAFLGHLELINVLKTGFRRAGLFLIYSQGFHPHPKLSFGKALSVGIESECEFCDLELLENISSQQIREKCAQVFPQGIKIKEVSEIAPESLAIEDSIKASIYEISNMGIAIDQLKATMASFDHQDLFLFELERKKKSNKINLKDYVAELALLENNDIRIQLLEKQPMVRIQEVIQALFGLEGIELKKIFIMKREVN